MFCGVISQNIPVFALPVLFVAGCVAAEGIEGCVVGFADYELLDRLDDFGRLTECKSLLDEVHRSSGLSVVDSRCILRGSRLPKKFCV